MARPREFDEEQVAEALLQTFWDLGYAATTLPHLSSASGLGPGSLYAAFGNKEAMFRIAIDRYQAYLIEAFISDARGLEGIRTLFNKVVSLTVKDPDRRGCLVINAVPESKALTNITQKKVTNGLRDFRKLIRRRLIEALNNSNMQDDINLESLTASLASSAVGIRVLGRAGMGRKHLQSIADGVVMLVEGYME